MNETDALTAAATDEASSGDLLETVKGTLCEWQPSFIRDFFSSALFPKIISATITLIVFYLLYRLTQRLIKRLSTPKWTAQAQNAVKKGVKYLFLTFGFLSVLSIFDIRLSGLLGAAGIAGIAVGFAAQTSFSNIISGFFLLTEKTMKVGDFITVGDVSGIVDSVDLLSVKIHTVDNQMIRIPNETIIKSNLKNTNYFPTRRQSISVSVAYDTPTEKATEILLNAAACTPGVLKDPAPGVFWEEFGDSGICARLSVWFSSDQYWTVRNALFTQIKKDFDQNGIVIPFPQMDIHTESEIIR